MRIDESRLPTAFKCSTVSKDELPLLRKVKNIIRRGRIESLEKDKIIFKSIISKKFRKQFHFVTCNLPVYVDHESLKEFWKNIHFENMTSGFLLRCQNPLR